MIGTYYKVDFLKFYWYSSGVSHADDLAYFLKHSPTSSEETDSDKAMTKLISFILINFMKTG